MCGDGPSRRPLSLRLRALLRTNGSFSDRSGLSKPCFPSNPFVLRSEAAGRASRRTLALGTALALLASPASAQDTRQTVQASPARDYAVTVYRDPNRGEGARMDRGWPRGFAMISETRTVTLPRGRSTLLFEGVAEGMVAVSAIVTGLPGGTIEKNRNADLLSPASLVDGMLGNRVTITRTNPGTGAQTSEQAVVRTRADGGLVLQTREGFEAVRCSGLPERLSFDRVPTGLSAQPVFSIDTMDPRGGTYQVTLTYLAAGFDWEANYVATLGEGRADGELGIDLMSWLSVLNDNGQSFPDAELMAVAGRIEVTSDYRELADAPEAPPLRLTCYPLGSTATGVWEELAPPPPPPPPPAAMAAMDSELIVVTGSRVARASVRDAELAVVAAEEQLGDLKLYRVPVPVTVAAKGLKQVAFLDKPEVRGRFLYTVSCDPFVALADMLADMDEATPAGMMLATRNEETRGLGAALPMGEMTVYEPSDYGPQLVARLDLRDYAVGQEIELALGDSAQVQGLCGLVESANPDERGRRWTRMRAVVSNANPTPVTVRMALGWPEDWDVRWPDATPRIKDGERIVELTIPANSRRSFDWSIRPTRLRRETLEQ